MMPRALNSLSATSEDAFDSRFDEVKDDVYITLAKEGALPERPFDTFKRMIEDDEFPEFKNFEVHPEDGPNEIEFRMTTDSGQPKRHWQIQPVVAE
jgi:hypothetical protein